MSLMDNVRKGRKIQPPRVVIYGQEGLGKSTTAASAPNPIFLPTEDGLANIDCHSLPLARSYAEFVDYLGSVCSEPHDYETLVVDSLDWLERLIHADVCRDQKVKTLADIGFNNGPKLALKQWKEVLDGLDYAHRERGMAIILVAHEQVEKFNDPESATYDRFTMRLDKTASPMIREWADAVLFATSKMRVDTQDLGFNKKRTTAKAVGAEGGERILRCLRSPACDAKNRYGIPMEIPLDWAEFAKYLTPQN